MPATRPDWTLATMPFSLQPALAFGLAAAVIAGLGLAVVALRRDWTLRQSGLIAIAAAGMLVALSLAHILPEALGAREDGGRFVLFGFLAGLAMSFAATRLFPEQVTGGPAAAMTPLLAIGVHSFLDGVMYSVTFAASFETGVYAAMPLILHELAEGVIAFAILARHGVSMGKALAIAFLVAALTTPLGALVSDPFVAGLGAGTIAALFAISAGLLLYVATGPLMSGLQDETPARAAGALAAGVALGLVMLTLPLPGHAEHGVHAH